MTSEGVKIYLQVLDIYTRMDDALGTVNQNRNVSRVGQFYHLFYWQDGAENIRNMGHRYEFGFGTQ